MGGVEVLGVRDCVGRAQGGELGGSGVVWSRQVIGSLQEGDNLQASPNCLPNTIPTTVRWSSSTH